MKATSLGDFEELILMTVFIVHEEAYAVSVKKELESRLSKKINISAIHTALYRLEEKGFLNSHMGGAKASRGGRRRRFFVPTAAGTKALEHLKELRENMYRLIPALSNG